jgi:hypothetical protein
MKGSVGVVVFAFSANAFAGCASQGAAPDDELPCGHDLACGQTLLDESAGPAADCTTEWPPAALRFETTAHLLDKDGERLYLSGPRLNRNGTALFVLAQSHPDTAIALPPAQLIRWVGDTVSRFEQPSGGMVPRAVSCDGMIAVGPAQSHDGSYRWSARDGFSLLHGASPSAFEGLYRATALGSDGTTLGTSESFRPGLTSAIDWGGGAAYSQFTLPEGASASPGWSGDGSVFIGYKDGALFLQADGAPATFLDIAIVEGSLGLPTAVSFDGLVVGGSRPFAKHDGQGPSYLWSARNQLEDLPVGAYVAAVTPEGVAVGAAPWPDQGDADFVWDRRHGARRLRAILSDHGLDLPRTITISEATDISADGRVITGLCAVDPGGGPQVFRAVLPAGTFD